MGKSGSKFSPISRQSRTKGSVPVDSGIEAQNDDLDDVFHPPEKYEPLSNATLPDNIAKTPHIEGEKKREPLGKRKSMRKKRRPGIRKVLYLGLCGRAKKGEYSPTKEETTAPKDGNESFRMNDADGTAPAQEHVVPKIIVHRDSQLSEEHENKPVVSKEENQAANITSQTQNDTFQEDGFREIEITEKPGEPGGVLPEEPLEPPKYGRRSDPTGLPKADQEGQKRRSEPIMQPIQTVITVRSEPVGMSPQRTDNKDHTSPLVELNANKSPTIDEPTVIPNHGIQYAAYMGKEASRRSDPLGLIRNVKGEIRRRSDPVGSSVGNWSNQNQCIVEEDASEDLNDDHSAVKETNNAQEDRNSCNEKDDSINSDRLDRQDGPTEVNEQYERRAFNTMAPITCTDNATNDVDELRDAILRGDVDSNTKMRKKTLRMYVCSTQSDTRVEREYLAKYTFPKIRTLCRNHGIDFKTVDMRSGDVPDDLIEPELCINEITKCLKDSIDAPCFLYLSGNTYGPSTPVKQVCEGEMRAILRECDSDLVDAITQCYRLDANAVPPMYVMQPAEVVLREDLESGALQGDADIHDRWQEIENYLVLGMRQAAVKSAKLTEKQKIKWKISTTEEEVAKGLINEENRHLHSICLARDIRQFVNDQYDPSHKLVPYFLDLQDGEIDVDAVKAFSELRQKVVDGNVPTILYTVDFADHGITESTHEQYLARVSEDVYNIVEKGLLRAVSNVAKLDKFCYEVGNHTTFCLSRADGFVGRSDLVQEATRYFVPGENRKLQVIHGVKGSGKTSLMSFLAVVANYTIFYTTGVNPILVTRFCGTAPDSNSVRPLLYSICTQIYRVLQLSDDVPYDFTKLCKYFHNILQLASKEQPLVIFIDSLDQLDDQFGGRSNLTWLPNELPEYAYVVVSTDSSNNECLRSLQEKMNIQNCYLEVSPISLYDADDIIQGCLGQNNRTLQFEQKKQVIKTALDRSEEEPSILRLKLVCDFASKLPSFDELPDYPKTVDGLVNLFFEKLEEDQGDAIVSKMVGLLGVSDFGLSEEELIDMISCDDKLMDAIFQDHHTSVRRLPYIVWSSFKNYCNDYLVEQHIYNKRTLNWFHPSFKGVAYERYCKDNLEPLLQTLTFYFSGSAFLKYEDRQISNQPMCWNTESSDLDRDSDLYNMNYICEFPSSLVKLHELNQETVSPEWLEKIFHLEFIESKCRIGFGMTLLHEMETLTKDFDTSTLYFQLKEFLSHHIHILEKYPELIIQQALNLPSGNPVYKMAKELFDTSG